MVKQEMRSNSGSKTDETEPIADNLKPIKILL